MRRAADTTARHERETSMLWQNIRPTPSPRPGAISRADIEIICMLAAISPSGCTASDLPARLGLASALLQPVMQAVGELTTRGLVTLHGERLALTDAGRERLSA
jgi:hypothetical protein